MRPDDTQAPPARPLSLTPCSPRPCARSCRASSSRPPNPQPAGGAERALDDVIDELEASARRQGYGATDCQTAGGLLIPGPSVAASGGALRLGFSSARDAGAAAARVAAAAEAEAARNAGGGAAGGYQVRAAAGVRSAYLWSGERPELANAGVRRMRSAGKALDSPARRPYPPPQATAAAAADAAPLVAEVLVAPAAQLDKDQVVDTTGAGDSFIGSVMYALVTGLPLPSALRLGAVVAACKCTALGARPGLPRREQLRPELLGAVR